MKLEPLRPLHHYQPAPVRVLTWFAFQVMFPVLTGGVVGLMFFALLTDTLTG